uniref:Endonuclease/exonuclease/phosphatase domain-containing protein n=1 Tax=Phlebotomus papatasi TaxID=29031 RepID=A0A1B0GQT3_PHLPP
MDRNMTVSITTFPNKDTHIATWSSTDGVTRNQIDHVLVFNRHRPSILNVRAWRGADCNTDHFRMTVIIKEEIIKEEESPQ